MRLAAFILLVAAPQDSADPYYKFAKGTSWTYGLNAGEDAPKGLKMTITISGEADGKVSAEMARGGGGGEQTKVLWYVADGILHWGEKKGDALNEAMGLYKAGSKKGDTWGHPGSDTVKKYSATHLGREEIKVPAGTYKDAVHTKVEFSEGGKNVQLDVFLVEKVGMVRMAYTVGDNRMSMDLEKFEPAK